MAKKPVASLEESVLPGMWALVTGASSGLGADFARQLAAHGCNLVLVARREERLQALKTELTTQHPVTIHVIAMDLGTPDAPQQLYDHIKQEGLSIDILINNAGFGAYGRFNEIPAEQERSMLQLDIVTLVALTRLFGDNMLNRKRGYILQVASLGAYQPTPTMATYCAAKSFVLNYGHAVHHELRNTGVSCTVLSPGYTATEFNKVSGQRGNLYQRLAMMKSDDVVRIGINAMLRRKPSVVAGRFNAIAAWSNRLIPRTWATTLSSWLMRQ